MKKSLSKSIIIGVSCITLVGAVNLILSGVIIYKYAAQLNVNATNVYIIIGLVAIFMCCVAVSVIRLITKRLAMHVNSLTGYSERISLGETEFKVEAPVEDEFSDVYKSLGDIVNVNREDAAIADAIANGDLTVSCTPKGERDLLGHALDHLLKVNNEVFSEIHESSYQLTTGAEQVASASQSLAQGSTEQASAIEQVTVSMKEIENMTSHNAEQANKASAIVSTTKNEADLGNKRMLQMKAAMGEINASSEKISKIIKVIDDISFQTNILALNAAVEAARAGVHGKGFAVVAEQIRELAGKSASAAAETADMIDDSIKKVHNGTKLADETSKALSSMMEAIEQVVIITDSITKASNEQAMAVSQIDQAINQVSQVVQNNSATSEECAAASEELSGQSLSLRQMISRFKLSGSKSSDNFMASYQSGSNSKTSHKFNNNVDPESIISLDGGFGKY